MNEIILPFLLTLLAGLSTMIGTIFIFLKGNINKLTINTLAFASGVMISVSLFDLIPEGAKLLLKEQLKYTSFVYLILSIITGIIFGVILDKIIPENNNLENKELYRVGVFSMIAIIFHNIPEGIATFLSSTSNLTLGIALTAAIALHNIPEGISISFPIYNATQSRKKAIEYTLISSLAEPVGGIIAFLILKPILTNTLMGTIFGIIAGIMIYIGMFKLLSIAIKYTNSKKLIIPFFLGVLIMIITHIIIA